MRKISATEILEPYVRPRMVAFAKGSLKESWKLVLVISIGYLVVAEMVANSLEVEIVRPN